MVECPPPNVLPQPATPSTGGGCSCTEIQTIIDELLVAIEVLIADLGGGCCDPIEQFTVTQVVETETSLTTGGAGPAAQTTDGVYALVVDVSAMLAGDRYEFLAYERVTAAGAQRSWSLGVFDGAQPSPLYVGPEFVFLHGWDFTAVLRAGVARSLTSSVRRVNGTPA